MGIQPDVFALLLNHVATARLIIDDGTGKMMPLALQMLRESQGLLKEFMGAPDDTLDAGADTDAENILSAANMSKDEKDWSEVEKLFNEPMTMKRRQVDPFHLLNQVQS